MTNNFLMLSAGVAVLVGVIWWNEKTRVKDTSYGDLEITNANYADFIDGVYDADVGHEAANTPVAFGGGALPVGDQSYSQANSQPNTAFWDSLSELLQPVNWTPATPTQTGSTVTDTVAHTTYSDWTAYYNNNADLQAEWTRISKPSKYTGIAQGAAMFNYNPIAYAEWHYNQYGKNEGRSVPTYTV